MAAASSSTRPPWVILQRVPRAIHLPGVPSYSLFSLAHAAPPGISELALDPGYGRDQAILAADPSGVLLIGCTFQCSISPPAADGSTAKDITTYILCDLPKDDLYPVFNPRGGPRPFDHYAGNDVGLIVGPGVDNYRNRMVVELMLSPGDDSATLFCYWTGNGEWVNKTVNYPRSLLHRTPWCTARVFSYQQQLWWVDLSQGILTCDPFQDSPLLRLVLLPPGEEVNLFRGDINKYRCINLSDGKLRFVRVNSGARVPKITMWTLDEQCLSWTQDYNVSFQDIWEHESYRRTRLPKRRPVLALIHPCSPEIVYFLLEKQLFGVNLFTKEVNECAKFDYKKRMMESSNSVFAWELPPSLISNSPAEPMEKDGSPRASSFNRIAESFSNSFLDCFMVIRSEQMVRISLRHLNKKIKKEGNKFRQPEFISSCFFDEKEYGSLTCRNYVHLNFSALIESEKLIIFSEFLNSTEEWNPNLINCRVLNLDNCNGGLYGQRNVEDNTTSRKRKKSLYCYACDEEVTHPLGGFVAGRLRYENYSASRQSKCVDAQETMEDNPSSEEDIDVRTLDIVGSDIEEGSANDIGAEFRGRDVFHLTHQEMIPLYRRLYKKRANTALVFYNKNNPDEHYEFTHVCLNDAYNFVDKGLFYMHINFKARSKKTGLEKLFFAELCIKHDADGKSLGYCATGCSIVDDNSSGGLKYGPYVEYGHFPDNYDEQNCYACAGTVKHPLGTSYEGGHYATDYCVNDDPLE